MTTARDLMTAPAECLSSSDTLADAARQLAKHDVGSMPVVDGGRLVGVLTDRDIVVSGLAKGLDANSATVGEVATSDVVTVNAGDDAAAVAKVLAEKQIRRVPVVDGDEVVCVIAQADVARKLDESTVGETVEKISQQ